MAKKYVFDEKAIICLDGIRWASKEDTSFGSYRLHVQYKGSSLTLNYESVKERDILYNEIKNSLPKPTPAQIR